MCHVLHLGVQTNSASSQHDGAQSHGAGAGRCSLSQSQATLNDNEHLLDPGYGKIVLLVLAKGRGYGLDVSHERHDLKLKE